MVSIGNAGIAGSSGALELLDAKRDIRYSVYDVNSTFFISGFAASSPTKIMSYPEQLRGVIFSTDATGSVNTVAYDTEKSLSATASLSSVSSDVFVPSDLSIVYSAQEAAGILQVVDLGTNGGSFNFSLPGAYKLAVNPSHTVALAMTRNTNNLYRVIKLNSNATPPSNALSCLPTNLPVYCIAPVIPATGSFDHPYEATFSPDGAQVYVMNCGQECGGTTSSVSFLNLNDIRVDNYSTANAPVVNVPIPGGSTDSISDGTNLYVAGQQLQSDGYFAGNLSVVSVASKTVTATYSISDGTHTKMLFDADSNNLWIGSQYCASGERQHTGQNYNCLTRFSIGGKTAQILPNVTPGGSTVVPYPNTDQNQYYYGSLTGLCWVQGFSKVYTAYGGQVHAFNTADGSEINNQNITVQGLALDVAYIDATTNAAN